MKLTVLVDNHTIIDQYFCGEPAFCCLIEDDDRTILFDTGYSGLFMDNAAQMGLPLSRVTDILLSHGHNDHTGGLFPYLERFRQPVKLYAHPLAFAQKRLDGLDIGMRQERLPEWVTPALTAAPTAVSAHVTFLGEIPRVHAHENDRAIGERLQAGRWESDELADDTAAALCPAHDAPLLLTGCAHSGVCNTFDRAVAVTGRAPETVLGGMHLFEADARCLRTIAYLKERGVKRLYPAHCTSLCVKAEMLKALATGEVGVGMSLQFE